MFSRAFIVQHSLCPIIKGHLTASFNQRIHRFQNHATPVNRNLIITFSKFFNLVCERQHSGETLHMPRFTITDISTFQAFSAALVILAGTPANAQQPFQDSAYVYSFSRDNVIENNTGFYHTSFNFTNGDKKHDYQLVANSSGYSGVYLSYKWFSLNYSFAIPGTQLDKQNKFHYTSLRYRFTDNHMMFEPFVNSFNGLLIPKGRRKKFEAFRNIQIRDAGMDIYYFTNIHHFSFRAAYNFSEQQKRSSGAFFLMGTPKWEQLHWSQPSRRFIQDSTTYGLLSSNPQSLCLIGRAGYAYNFVFNKGKWMVSPSIMAGEGALHQLNMSHLHLEKLTDLQGSLNAGYNGSLYYLYANASWEKIQTNLSIKSMRQVNTDISLTAGYRFGNAGNKILKIL